MSVSLNTRNSINIPEQQPLERLRQLLHYSTFTAMHIVLIVTAAASCMQLSAAAIDAPTDGQIDADLLAESVSEASSRSDVSFNYGWRFHLGDSPDA